MIVKRIEIRQDGVPIDRGQVMVDESGQVGPTITQMTSNLVAAIARNTANRLRRVPDDVQAIRMKHCSGCDYWSGEARLGLGKCSHPSCGCTRIKTIFAAEKCPIGRWHEYPAAVATN